MSATAKAGLRRRAGAIGGLAPALVASGAALTGPSGATVGRVANCRVANCRVANCRVANCRVANCRVANWG